VANSRSYSFAEYKFALTLSSVTPIYHDVLDGIINAIAIIFFFYLDLESEMESSIVSNHQALNWTLPPNVPQWGSYRQE
jgi:hypothetical protein